MRLEYTPAVATALARAAGWARHVGAGELMPDHLLQGLLAEEEGHPCRLLAQYGLDLSRIRRPLPDGPADAAGSSDVAETVPQHPRVRAVLRQAWELSSFLSAEGTIASDQVLLALLQVDDDVRRWLMHAGLDYARLERELMGEAPPLALDEPLDFTPPREEHNVARILDANFNRAREALRVLEDHARFGLDDKFLTDQLKRLRHDLCAALAAVPSERLLSSRETQSDVGTALSTPQELDRASVAAVVEANARRLSEALRTLEEYGKIHSPELGRALEALRYRAYAVEKALVLGGRTRARLAEARLYVLVTESQCKFSLAGTIKELVAGGAQIIQLREKNVDDRTLLAKAREVRRLTRQAGALFILNDRPDLAQLAEADGVHLGQEDLTVADARKLLGPDHYIGVSTHNLEQLRQAILGGADYVGVGPTFPSTTKDFAKLAGLDYLREAMSETSLPAFAIGGITLENLPQAIAAGATRVAVSGALCQADDPRATAAKMRQLLDARR